MHHKNPKNWDTRKIAVNILKLEQYCFTIELWVQKTAQSDQGLHCLPRPVCPKTWDHYGILEPVSGVKNAFRW